ncbi:hypothetical protein ABID42_000463 [Arcicella rosea]|uniref:hypothetical protein n=1 Tax=Arcicella rosea TaxID=502909 RepID=UPI00345D89EB
MKNKFLFAFTAVLSFFGKELIAQTDNHTIGITIPAVTMIGIAPSASKNLTMNFTAPTTAGEPIVAPANNSTLYLQYSSILTGPATTRKISVKTSALINGVNISVTAANPTATNLLGQGGTGSNVPALAVTDTPLISGITSCATGILATDGSNITYSLNTGTASNYANLRSGTTSVTITYTLSD